MTGVQTCALPISNPAIMLKTFAYITDFTPYEVFQAIADVNIRKQWDTIFSEFKIIDTIQENEIIYMRIKSPSVFVSDRDFVQQRKIWTDFPEKNSVCMHFKSVIHPAAPEMKKVIRGEIIISGYYIRTLSVKPQRTFLSIITQSNIKGHIPTWLVNKVAQRAPRDWVVNLQKGCQMIRQREKTKKLM